MGLGLVLKLNKQTTLKGVGLYQSHCYRCTNNIISLYRRLCAKHEVINLRPIPKFQGRKQVQCAILGLLLAANPAPAPLGLMFWVGHFRGGGESEIGYPKVKWVIFCKCDIQNNLQGIGLSYRLSYRPRACSTVVSAHPMFVGLQIQISRQDLMGHICLGKST